MQFKTRNSYVKNRWLRLYLSISDILYSTYSKFFKTPSQCQQFNIKKILLRNPANLGDVFYTLQLVPIIKEFYPKAKVGVLCSSKCYLLVNLFDCVDYIHIDDHWRLHNKGNVVSAFIKWFIHLGSLIKEIKSQNYDLAFDCYYYYPSGSFTIALSGIPIRVGYLNNTGDSLFTNGIGLTNKDMHNFLYQLELIKLLINDCDINIRKKLSFRNKIDLNNILDRFDFDKDYIIVAPCASTEQRELDINYLSRVVMQLLPYANNIMLVGYGERENRICKTIIESCNNDKIISLCSMLSLNELFVLIENTKALIGMESFISHIGAFYEKKQVTIMHGASNLEQWKPFDNPNSVVVRSKLSCSPCYFPNRCPHPRECLNIDLCDIERSIKELLEK